MIPLKQEIRNNFNEIKRVWEFWEFKLNEVEEEE